MAKFYGKVGFADSSEETPGVWTENFTEYFYYGDVTKNRRSLRSGDGINDDVIISNQISIVADPYARKYFHLIRYAEYNGIKWKVSDVEEEFPRLILTLGGVYNV